MLLKFYLAASLKMPIQMQQLITNIVKRNFKQSLLTGLFFLSIISVSFGQVLEPVKWDSKYKELGNDEYELIFTATMEDGWNVYSQETEDDDKIRPIPTQIYYDSILGAELIGIAEEFGHRKEGLDPNFDGVNVIKYLSDEPFIIKQRIKVNDKTKPIYGALEFMTCDDSKCLPPAFVDFQFRFDGSDNTEIKLVGDTLNQKVTSLFETFKDPVGNCGEEKSLDQSYWIIFIFGFLGGLFALLTPCVFPMIPLTVSFFTKDTKRSAITNALIYGASIIVIYVLLGLLITIIFGPAALNEFSTNWIANTLFFIIFIVFAISFFGYFEITLPSSWSSKSDQMADKGGLIGIFFMAFTLALVSFSCTGPIIGTAIVQAATTGSLLGPAIVMFGFALALAIPFGLFAAFPSWLNSLPRSGSWMNSVKVVLGFLEVALAFKFLSVADMTQNWGFLRYEPFLIVWILVALGLTLYLFGFLKFPHDSPIKKLSKLRIAFASISLITFIYLCAGFMMNKETGLYKGLNLFSGLLPPTGYNFFLTAPDLDPEIKKEFPSYTLCANNIPCFKEYEEGMAYAKKVEKPVFMDFTGYGCVNCRKTEDKIWSKPEITLSLKNDWVLLSLYCDDRKPLKEKYISKALDSQIETVGHKWTDFQVVNFESNAQPLYIMLNNDAEVMGFPRAYEESAQEYKDYMDCGMETYKNSK